MRLGVDARGLYGTGIGRYLREVLAVLLDDPRFGRVSLLGDPGELATFVAEHGAGERVDIVPHHGSWYSRRAQQSWLSLALRGRTRADVWFFPIADVPLLAHPRRSVVTVHDLTPHRLPELSSAKLRAATTLLLRGAVGRAQRVIAISHSTRADLVERFPRVAPKVEVVHHGVTAAFHPPAPGTPVPERVAALGAYLLYVGNLHAHKNVEAAVEALALLRAGGRALRLVLVGGRHNHHRDALLRHAAAAGVADAVVEYGPASDDELRALYARCTAFVFPSLYEGFGLPVLEAMACGAPVVASDRSSVPEVLGDAGFLVDPRDAGAIAAAVARLGDSAELRAACARRGVERAATFSWPRAAGRTADILHAVATGSSSALAGGREPASAAAARDAATGPLPA